MVPDMLTHPRMPTQLGPANLGCHWGGHVPFPANSRVAPQRWLECMIDGMVVCDRKARGRLVSLDWDPSFCSTSSPGFRLALRSIPAALHPSAPSQLAFTQFRGQCPQRGACPPNSAAMQAPSLPDPHRLKKRTKAGAWAVDGGRTAGCRVSSAASQTPRFSPPPAGVLVSSITYADLETCFGLVSRRERPGGAEIATPPCASSHPRPFCLTPLCSPPRRLASSWASVSTGRGADQLPNPLPRPRRRPPAQLVPVCRKPSNTLAHICPALTLCPSWCRPHHPQAPVPQVWHRTVAVPLVAEGGRRVAVGGGCAGAGGAQELQGSLLPLDPKSALANAQCHLTSPGAKTLHPSASRFAPLPRRPAKRSAPAHPLHPRPSTPWLAQHPQAARGQQAAHRCVCACSARLPASCLPDHSTVPCALGLAQRSRLLWAALHCAALHLALCSLYACQLPAQPRGSVQIPVRTEPAVV